MTDSQSCTHAKRNWIALRDRLLRQHAGELKTKGQVVKALKLSYDKLLTGHLRGQRATYKSWIELGPKPELDELVAAAEDLAVWDRLVDRIVSRGQGAL